VLLRQLEYLTVLARERHFGRAALACHVSQPSLSAAIRKLEEELGVPLVQRGHRYDDLTPEGRALLGWAQQAVATVDGLAAEASRLRGDLSGTLRIGVIPTALPAISLITGPLLDRHHGIRLEARSHTSIDIGQQLNNHDIDLGITYLDNEPLGAVHATPLYDERYVYLTASDAHPGDTIAWSQLRDEPLCLLTPDMQNRRIVGAAFADAGVRIAPRVEVDSITAMLAFARRGRSCVMAHTWLWLHGLPPGMRALRLTDPEPVHSIGLVTSAAGPDQPLVAALINTLRDNDIGAQLKQLLPSQSRARDTTPASC
jgi:DNA-binding transcriptional LysR family regulator